MLTDDLMATALSGDARTRKLRKAAELMRQQNTPRRGFMDDTFLATADLLSMAADHSAGRGSVCSSCVDQALVVALNYLGEGKA